MEFKKTILHLDHDFDFFRGNLEWEGFCNITGTNVFIYRTSGQSTFEDNSTLFIEQDVTFSYDPVSQAKNLFDMEGLSVIFLNGCKFHAGAGGFQYTKGTILIENKTVLTSDGTSAATGIIWGDGTVANNVHFDVFPNASLVLESGYMTFDNVI
jgi:hypothetical protein